MNPVRVEWSDDFRRESKNLSKSFRSVPRLIASLTRTLESGEQPGVRVTGIKDLVFKVRLANPDAGKGKRGGFRLVYYLRRTDNVVLLTIYSKNRQSDVTTARLEQIIAALPDSDSPKSPSSPASDSE